MVDICNNIGNLFSLRNCLCPSNPKGYDLFNDDSKSKIDEESSCCLADRFDCNWELIPGIVTLCICIIGIVASVFYFGTPYFAIVFAAGTLASLGSIWIAYNAENLRSLAENVDRLEQTVDSLSEELEKVRETAKELEEVKVELTKQNEALAESIEEFKEQLDVFKKQHEEQIGAYKEENLTLKQHNINLEEIQKKLQATEKKLTTQVDELETKLKRFIELFNAQADQLESINASLEKVGSLGTEANLKFTQSAKLFTDTLQTAKSELGNSIIQFQQSYEHFFKINEEKTLKLVEQLKNVFEQKDEQIEKITKIEKYVEDATNRYIRAVQQHSAYEAKMQQLDKLYTERLQEFDRLQKSFQKFEGVLQDHSASLSKEVEITRAHNLSMATILVEQKNPTILN